MNVTNMHLLGEGAGLTSFQRIDSQEKGADQGSLWSEEQRRVPSQQWMSLLLS